MRTKILLLSLSLLGASSFALSAQTPAANQVVIQAITPGQTAKPIMPAVPVASENDAVLKLLQKVQASNEEVLKKQAAALQQLDEMEKAADQLKIYTKRG